MTFYRVLASAISDMVLHGFDSQSRVEHWVYELKRALKIQLLPPRTVQEMVYRALTDTFERTLRAHTGKRTRVNKTTVAKLTPQLRTEMNRRIMATTQLLHLTRDESTAKVVRSFTGWATSIPAGGTPVAKQKEEKDAIRRTLTRIPNQEKRVILDQSYKLKVTMTDTLAKESGAIAAMWHDRGEHDSAYNARRDHLARSGTIFTIRNSWAHKQGLIKAPNGYTDDFEMVGEFPYCQCSYTYFYSADELPTEFLTVKGKNVLESKQMTEEA
jgi:hypothetical protein